MKNNQKFIDDVKRAIEYLDYKHYNHDDMMTSFHKEIKTALKIAELVAGGGETLIFAPFKVGNTYETLTDGYVKFISVHREGSIDETMCDEYGVHRYTCRDFGRVTGTDHEIPDGRNVKPLYTRANPLQSIIDGLGVE